MEIETRVYPRFHIIRGTFYIDINRLVHEFSVVALPGHKFSIIFLSSAESECLNSAPVPWKSYTCILHWHRERKNGVQYVGIVLNIFRKFVQGIRLRYVTWRCLYTIPYLWKLGNRSYYLFCAAPDLPSVLFCSCMNSRIAKATIASNEDVKKLCWTSDPL